MFNHDKKGFITGFGLGFCAGLISREFVPGLGKTIRPTSKTILRLSITAVEKIRELMAKTKEEVEDLTAEVFSELEQNHRQHEHKRTRNPRKKKNLSHEE
jgi:hypothetical protein